MPTWNDPAKPFRSGFDSESVAVRCPACRATVLVEPGEQFAGALIDCGHCDLPFYLVPGPIPANPGAVWQLSVPCCDEQAQAESG